MKTIFLTCLAFLSFKVIVSAQSEQQEKLAKQRYLAAFEYIHSDSLNAGKTVHVFNDTTTAYFASYLKLLDKYPIEKEVALADYTNFDIFSNFQSHYSSTLAELDLPKKLKADLALVFSNIRSNMMEATIVNNRLKNQEQKPLYVLDMQSLTRLYTPFTLENILSYTQGYAYLFIFYDNSATIKDVIRQQVIYD